MFRTFVWFLYFSLYQVLLIPVLLKANRLAAEKRIQELDALSYAVAVPWARSLLKLAGCTVQVNGAENLPENSAVLFVSNHQSNFDIPLLIAYINGSKGFVAKESLGRFPLLNQWMRHIHCVFIKRGSPRDAAAAITAGVRNLKAGYSMVIFPEGTRSADGSLQEFKAGALKLATKAGVPVVPIAINGSIKMMRKGSLIIHPAQVELTVLPPVMPEAYDANDTVGLAEAVKAAIAAVLPPIERNAS